MDRLRSGKWRVRVRLPEGGRVTKVVDTETKANLLRVALLQELARGETPCPGSWTLDAWAERWHEKRERQGVTRNSRDERTRWKRYVSCSPIGKQELQTIRGKDIRDWLDGLMVKRTAKKSLLRRQTVANAFSLLRKCLSDAASAELIHANPARGVSVPRRTGDSDDWTFLSIDEIEAVLGCQEIPQEARFVYAVAIYTGMRAGELWALRWEDVALGNDQPCITVRRSHEHKPKNGKVQTVPLLPAAREALRQWRQLTSFPANDDLVFPTERGLQRHRGDDAGWSSRVVRDQFRTGHRELAGITRRVRFHDLRHTCASHLVMGSWGKAWPLTDVRSFLRHASTTTTERYAHLSPDHLHRQAEATQGAPPFVTQLGHRTGVATSGKISQTPYFSAAPSGRVELPANGLGNPVADQELQPKTSTRDPTPSQLALNFLEAIESGHGVSTAMERMVEAVLKSPAVALAVEVKAGGALRVRRAVELAGVLLEQDLLGVGSTREGLSKA